MTTTPLFLESWHLLESAGPGLTKGPNGGSVSDELLNASSRSIQDWTEKPRQRDRRCRRSSAPQQPSSRAVRGGKSPVQFPPPLAEAATLRSAAVHCRTSCVSCGPRILPSFPTEHIASVADVPEPAATVSSGTPQTVRGKKSSVMCGWLPQKPGVRVKQPLPAPGQTASASLGERLAGTLDGAGHRHGIARVGRERRCWRETSQQHLTTRWDIKRVGRIQRDRRCHPDPASVGQVGSSRKRLSVAWQLTRSRSAAVADTVTVTSPMPSVFCPRTPSRHRAPVCSGR